jgi:hypothetical protein
LIKKKQSNCDVDSFSKQHYILACSAMYDEGVVMFDTESKYFAEHKNEFIKQYLNKYLVIHEEEYLGPYESDEDAYYQAVKKYDAGTFMIKHISDQIENQIQTFTSFVYV